jgi:protein-L-isoaspartate O-methyltransferase/radical SAM superfamily enzyme YgiQ (UPF0313 family)
VLIHTRSATPRVLLLWPGTEGAAAGNFGVPQLVGLATYVRAKTGAHVDVIDLACEPALGPVSLPRLFAGPDGAGYDVIGFSCYASYDWLKVEALAGIARGLYPDALICAGGYHASARPAEFIHEGSPFDAVVVGEGEKPLVQLVESVRGGAPLRGVILGPDPIEDLDAELPETDWSYLDRYRPIARRIASQAEIYLSRGCPFDCAFCMERAKREVSWRGYSVDRAIAELERLDRFLDTSSWTIYFADALFGMRGKWRKEFLAKLAASSFRSRKNWLLIRVDMIDDEDLRLFGEANCGLGFGLESGDPTMLATARKAGKLETYLDRMKHVAVRARELDVPWGANVICGHPGETEASMRTSAAYLKELFLDPRGTTGFLSVDPFRLYPGSPIDAERGFYESTYGTRFHRPDWWHDGDQEMLSEWVDPSRELGYRRRAELQTELLGPILSEIPKHFAYGGKAGTYFRRAIDDQIASLGAPNRFHYAERYYAWQRYLGLRARGDAERGADADLAAASAELRAPWVIEAMKVAEIAPDAPSYAPIAAALREVRRELFVPLDAMSRSVLDEAIPLDRTELATVSAMHAYARTFDRAGVTTGARVVDLGAGTGYGAALLAKLVGATGKVHAIEIDPALVDRARALLADQPQVAIVTGDALDPSTWPPPSESFTIVVAGFALCELPGWLHGRLPPQAVVVAPVVRGDAQELVRFVRTDDGWDATDLGGVRYVAARDAPPPVAAPGPTRAATTEKRRRSLAIAR